MKEKTINTNNIFSGRVFDITLDEVELENGTRTSREVAWHKGGACIAALDKDDNIYLVRQFRYPFKRELLEIPAGKLNDGEPSENCAIRELEEETGLKAEGAKLISEGYATPAYSSEISYIYYTDDVETGKQSLDEGEFLDVVKIPFNKALEMVMNDEIHDMKTQIAILKTAVARKT